MAVRDVWAETSGRIISRAMSVGQAMGGMVQPVGVPCAAYAENGGFDAAVSNVCGKALEFVLR